MATVTRYTGTDGTALAWSTVSPASGDLFLLFFVNDGGDDQTSVPTGLTRLDSNADPSTIDVEGGLYWKDCTGSETGNVFTDESDFGVTAEAFVWHAFKIPAADWNSASDPEFTRDDSQYEDASKPNATSLTPSWGSAATIWICAIAHDDKTADCTATGQSSATNFQNDESHPGGGAVEVATSWKEATAASDDPAEATTSVTNQDWIAWNVGVRPAGAGAQTISPALVAQTLATFAPSFDIDLKPGLVTQLAATYAPAFSVSVKPALESQALTAFDPQVNMAVVPALTTQTLTPFDPQVNPGPVQIDPALVTQTLAAFGPQLNLTLLPTLVTQTLSPFGPTLTPGPVQIDPALVSQTVTPFAPQMNLVLSPALVAQALATYTPTLHLRILPGLETQLVTPFGPTVTTSGAPQQIDPALVSQLVTAYGPQLNLTILPDLAEVFSWGFWQGFGPGMSAPDPSFSLGAVTVSPALVTQTITAYDPGFNQQIDPALVSQAASPYAPQINLNVHPALVSQIAAASDPTLSLQIVPALVAQAATAYDPAISVVVAPALTTQTATAYDPTLSPGAAQITPVLVAQTATPYDPSVSSGALQIAPGLATQLITPNSILVGPLAATIADTVGGRFWRNAAGHLVLERMVMRVRPGLHAYEGDEVASAVFLLDWSQWEDVQIYQADIWTAHSGSAIATLLAEINARLQLLGYRGPSGEDLT